MIFRNVSQNTLRDIIDQCVKCVECVMENFPTTLHLMKILKMPYKRIFINEVFFTTFALVFDPFMGTQNIK